MEIFFTSVDLFTVFFVIMLSYPRTTV